jgi:hypothetical protein
VGYTPGIRTWPERGFAHLQFCSGAVWGYATHLSKDKTMHVKVRR